LAIGRGATTIAKFRALGIFHVRIGAMMHDFHTAEDVVQEAFVTVWSALPLADLAGTISERIQHFAKLQGASARECVSSPLAAAAARALMPISV
jgi:hypothetical protein